MRKITSFLMLLTLCAGASWAQTAELKVSTSETSPENIYFIKNAKNIFMKSSTCPRMVEADVPGRFAFFATGTENTYKMLSVDEGKWVSYTASIGAEKASLVDAQADALAWVITASTRNNAACYQFLASGTTDCYMNWNGGAAADKKVGFWSDPASSDDGSAWKLALAATSGKFYLQEKGGTFVSLDNLGFEPVAPGENKLATLASAPEVVNIEVTSGGKWKISNENGAYLGKSSNRGWNSWVDAGQSNFEWIVEPIVEDGDVYYTLLSESGKYLGTDNHVAAEPLYVNKGKAVALRIRLLSGTDKLAKVTYSFVYDGVEKFTQTAFVKVGEAYPNINAEIPYGFTLGSKPEGMVPDEGVITKVIEYTKQNDLPFEAFADVASITQWYYVRMHANANTTSYLKKSDDNVAWADRTASVSDDLMWGFVGDAFNMKMVNKSSKQMVKSTGSGNATLAAEAEATFFKVNVSQANGNWFCLKNTASKNYLNAQGSSVAHWTDNDNGSSLQVELEENVIFPVKAGWSTFYNDARVVVPEGMNVYIVSDKTDKSATLETVSGTVLPENTGVLLNAASEMTIVKTLDNRNAEQNPDLAVITGNLLLGSATDTNVAEDAYVLANGPSGVGFYLAKKNQDGDTAFKNNAHKAYLPKGASSAPALTFDFGTETAIENVTVEKTNAAIYDLSGRRVKSATKGIFIINGKKVIK